MGDFGTACLLSLIQFYGKNHSLSYLKILTGARVMDCGLLGLKSAAEQVGFEVKALRLTCESLETLENPVILTVKQGEKVSRAGYVICYGHKKVKGETVFIIGDPHDGIKECTPNELDIIWKRKICLSLVPTEFFYNNLSVPSKTNSLGQLMNSEPPLMSIISLLALLQSLLYLIPIYCIAQFSEMEFMNEAKSSILYGFVSLLAVVVLHELFKDLRIRLVLSYAMLTAKKVHRTFMGYLIDLPKLYLDSEKETMNLRYNDIHGFESAYEAVLGKGVFQTILIVILSIALCYFSPVSFIIMAAFFALYYTALNIKRVEIEEKVESVFQHNVLFRVLFREIAVKLDTIKLMGKQNDYRSSLETFITSIFYTVYPLKIWRSRYQSLYRLSFVLLFGTVSFYLLYISVSNSVLLTTLYLLTAISFTAIAWLKTKDHLFEVNRYLNQMDEFKYIASTIKVGKEPIQSLKSIALHQINLRLQKGFGPNVLKKSVSLFANKGEMIGIVGQNGSGKTLLSQVLLKEYDYTEGSILLNENIELKNTIHDQYQKILAYVSEKPVIFKGSVFSNVAFEHSMYMPEEVDQFILKHQLQGFMASLPNRGDCVIGEQDIQLSTAEQKFLSLIRALYKKPQLLILDEPFAALSKEMVGFVFNLLKNASKDMIIILLTSNEMLAKSTCTRVYNMNQQIVPEVTNS